MIKRSSVLFVLGSIELMVGLFIIFVPHRNLFNALLGLAFFIIGINSMWEGTDLHKLNG